MRPIRFRVRLSQPFAVLMGTGLLQPVRLGLSPFADSIACEYVRHGQPRFQRVPSRVAILHIGRYTHWDVCIPTPVVTQLARDTFIVESI